MLSLERSLMAPPNAAKFDLLIFTSPAAVYFFPGDADWHNTRALAVGERTAALARNAGFKDVLCTGHTARNLLATMSGMAFENAFYPSAEIVTADLALAFPGRVTRVTTYSARMTPFVSDAILDRLRSQMPAFAPLFSKRSALAFAQALRNNHVNQLSSNITAIGISDAILEISTPPWGKVIVADQPTTQSMAAALRVELGSHHVLAA